MGWTKISAGWVRCRDSDGAIYRDSPVFATLPSAPPVTLSRRSHPLDLDTRVIAAREALHGTFGETEAKRKAQALRPALEASAEVLRGNNRSDDPEAVRERARAARAALNMPAPRNQP